MFRLADVPSVWTLGYSSAGCTHSVLDLLNCKGGRLVPTESSNITIEHGPFDRASERRRPLYEASSTIYINRIDQSWSIWNTICSKMSGSIVQHQRNVLVTPTTIIRAIQIC